MMDGSTRDVLKRARELERLEAAALAALAMLVPSVSAARGILI